LLKQADVEIDFELTSIGSADPFDPSWLLDIEKHCREADASVHGGVGPFGLVLLASDNMEEHTSVHFRVYKSLDLLPTTCLCDICCQIIQVSEWFRSLKLCIDRFFFIRITN